MAKNRTEHLEWCKQRALEYLDKGDRLGAWASMASDLTNHEDTRDHMGLQLGMMLHMGGHLDTVDKMRKHIEGFK